MSENLIQKKFANIIKLDFASTYNSAKKVMKTNCVTKKHPKVCKHFKANGKCRHKEEFAYQNVKTI